jgi:hypothetical protein
MRKLVALTAVSLLVVAAPALAQKKKSKAAAKPAPAAAAEETSAVDDEEPAPKESDAEAAAAAEREVQYKGAELGEVVGGATGFVFKRGFYTQSDLGGYFRLFGYTDDQTGGLRAKPVFWSNLQPYIGLSVGYDVLDFLAVQGSLGTGFVANAAPIQGDPDSPRDYGMIFTNIAVVPSWNFFDRYVLMGKVFGGGTFITPPPSLTVPFYGFDVGGGIGLQYATLLTDVIIGIEVNSFVSFIPDGGGGLIIIPGFNFAPVIKYVF